MPTSTFVVMDKDSTSDLSHDTLAACVVMEGTSDITPALDISDDQSQILETLEPEPSHKKKQPKRNAKSGVWKFFKSTRIENSKTWYSVNIKERCQLYYNHEHWHVN